MPRGLMISCLLKLSLSHELSLVCIYLCYVSDANECLYPSVHKCREIEMCVDKRGSWTCQPCDQFTSDGRCRLSHPQTVDCFTQMCQNNGTCGWNGLCICPPGYSGTFCENNHPELHSESCISNPCLNGGACLQEGSRVVCQCRENWTGRLCQVGTKLQEFVHWVELVIIIIFSF